MDEELFSSEILTEDTLRRLRETEERIAEIGRTIPTIHFNEPTRTWTYRIDPVIHHSTEGISISVPVEEPVKEVKELKVGDTVTITNELSTEIPGVVSPMLEYKGCTAQITRIYESAYKLDIDDGRWNWWKYCFKGFEETKEEKIDDRERTDFEKGDLVKIRSIESMKKQFYTYRDGSISCRDNFSKEMYPLENKQAILRDIDRYGTVRLSFLNAKELDTNFCFSTDMIEIVEKNFVDIHKTKEKKEMKKYGLDDEVIKEMLGKVDVKKVKKIISSSYRRSAKSLEGIEKMLEEWAIAKRELYLILGKRLRVSKEIEWEAEETDWKEQINKLITKFPGTYYVLKQIYWRNFKDNEYVPFDSSFANNYMPDAKEGMKLTTFLSRAFKNNEFDTELSKAVDQSKIKGVITISIDPIDYLLMSLNKSGWQSCHSIHEGSGVNFGCYVSRTI